MPDIEKIKREGVAIDLNQVAWQGYRAVSPDDHYRLKTQGICSQRNSQVGGDGRFMLRIKIPFGQVRPSQLAKLGYLAEQYGRGWGHLTTRQGMELHSVRLEDIPVIFEQLKEVGLTTKAACGDTIRNVVTCPHVGDEPSADGPLFDVRPWALLVQNHFLELGVDNLNLPRKMNVYMSACQNCIGHARINDLGLIATARHRSDGKIEYGFALWVGGGLGANPRLAQQLRSFIPFQEVLPTLEAVVRLYIEHGSRRSRATSKLKFLIEEWGMGRFSETFEGYYRQVLPRFTSKPLPRLKMLPTQSFRQAKAGADPLSGQVTELNILIPEGEIRAEELNTLAGLCSFFGEGHLYFTKEQNVRFKNLGVREAKKLREALEQAGFQTEGAGRVDDVLACPGTSFCPIAATPSLAAGQVLRERLGELIATNQLPTELQKLRIHISGCPNSCAQHQVADIGLAGTRVHPLDNSYSGVGYQLFLGGNMEGTGKLALLVSPGIPDELVAETIIMVLALYQHEKQPREEFSSYVARIGQELWEERLEGIIDNLKLPQVLSVS